MIDLSQKIAEHERALKQAVTCLRGVLAADIEAVIVRPPDVATIASAVDGISPDDLAFLEPTLRAVATAQSLTGPIDTGPEWLDPAIARLWPRIRLVDHG